MMNSEDVLIQTIITEAKEKAQQIIEETNRKVEQTLENQLLKARDDAKPKVAYIINKARLDVKIKTASKITDTMIKARWMILEKKQELIENVLTQTKQKLKFFISTDEYLKVLENYIIESGILIGKEKIEVILNEHDSNLPLNFGYIEERISKETNLDVRLLKSEKKLKNSIGGSIIQTLDGKIVVNNTFENVIERNDHLIRKKIVKILFS